LKVFIGPLLGRKMLRKFVDVAGIFDIDLPGIGRVRERKIVGLDLVPSLPVPGALS
jgi:hypothetical protein